MVVVVVEAAVAVVPVRRPEEVQQMQHGAPEAECATTEEEVEAADVVEAVVGHYSTVVVCGGHQVESQ